MGVQGGVENLPWLFSATFATMLAAAPLFGWAAARLPRRRLVPWTFLFFIANVLVFYALFAGPACGGARVLRLGERFQFVRGVAFLESHARLVPAGAGGASLRLRVGRGQLRRARGPDAHRAARRAVRDGKFAAGVLPLPRPCGRLHL